MVVAMVAVATNAHVIHVSIRKFQIDVPSTVTRVPRVSHGDEPHPRGWRVTKTIILVKGTSTPLTLRVFGSNEHASGTKTGITPGLLGSPQILPFPLSHPLSLSLARSLNLSRPRSRSLARTNFPQLAPANSRQIDRQRPRARFGGSSHPPLAVAVALSYVGLLTEMQPPGDG